MVLLALAGCPGEKAPDRADSTDSSSAWTPPCAAGEVRDGDVCVPEACGVGRYGGKTGDIYVDSRGPTGDGTEDSPFATLAEAIGPARTVVVATGVYEEVLALGAEEDGLRILGRCAELVTLSGSDDEVTVVTVYEDAAVYLEGVSLADGRRGGLRVERGAEVELENVALVGNRWIALDVEGFLNGRGVRILDTAPDDVDGLGVGAWVWAGGTLILAASELLRNTTYGIVAAETDTNLTLDEVTISETALDPSGWSGLGLSVESGARAVVTALTMEGNHQVAVYATGAGTSLSIAGCRIAGTLPVGTGIYGAGVEGARGAELTMDDCVVEGNVEGGIGAFGANALVTFTNGLITGTVPAGDGAGGYGVTTTEGGILALTDTIVEGNAAGILADIGGRLDAVRLTLRDNGDATLGGLGGVIVQGGAVLTLTDSTVGPCVAPGVLAQGEGTVATLTEVVVDEVTSPDTSEGVGVGVTEGASLVMTGGEVVRGDAEGMAVGGPGSNATVLDVRIADHRGTSGTIRYGRGMDVNGGGRLDASDFTIERTRELGLLASDEGTVVNIHTGTVSGTTTATRYRSAIGLAAQTGATVVATDLDVTGNSGPGLVAISGASVECSGCEVSGNGFAGALVRDATLRLRSSELSDNGEDPSAGGGVGVYASDAYGPVTIDISDALLVGNRLAGLWVDGQGSVTVERTRIEGGPGYDLHGVTVHGNAVMVSGGAVTLVSTTLAASRVAVLLDDATATMAGTVWDGNALDVRVQDCDGDEVALFEGATVDLCPVVDEIVLPLWFPLLLDDVVVK